MENKRSAGVTIFAWIFIILAVKGLLDLLRAPDLTEQIRSLSSGTSTARIHAWLVFSFLTSILSLLAAIFILRLKEWSRKLVIILRCVIIIFTCIFWLPVLNLAQSEEFKISVGKAMRKAEESKKAEIQKMYKPEYQEKALKGQLKSVAMVNKLAPTLLNIVFFIPMGWNMLIIFYFTRPKVKEQFV